MITSDRSANAVLIQVAPLKSSVSVSFAALYVCGVSSVTAVGKDPPLAYVEATAAITGR